MAEYHYRFYHLLASVLGERWTEEIETRFSRIVREELSADAHGEVDEPSWRLKQGLRRSKNGAAASTGRRSRTSAPTPGNPSSIRLRCTCTEFAATSTWIRVPANCPAGFCAKRLMVLEELFPPPAGYAVFPEQLEP